MGTETKNTRQLRALLLRWLDQSGKTQEDLAAALGKSQAAVSKYLSGKTTMSVPIFLRMAEALGQDPVRVLAQEPREGPAPVKPPAYSEGLSKFLADPRTSAAVSSGRISPHLLEALKALDACGALGDQSDVIEKFASLADWAGFVP